MTRLRSLLFALLLAAALWLDPLWLPLVPVALFMPVFGTSCTIFTDDFSTDRTGTDYTTVSGSWSVGSGVLTTGSTGALIVENTAGSTGHGRVSATVKVNTLNGSARVIGSYVDSSNYLFAEMTIAATSTLKLWSKASGTDTQVGSTYTFTGSTSTTYTICVSWDGASATATINTTAGVIRGAFTGTGNQAGLGASPNGGTATFDAFSLAKHYADDGTCSTCGGVTCPLCATAYDGGFEFNVSGLTNGVCGSCSSLNGLYILRGPAEPISGPGCQYQQTQSLACVGSVGPLFRLLEGTSTCSSLNYDLQFDLDFPFQALAWHYDSNTAIECRSLSGQAMSICYNGGLCNMSGSSVTATSI